MDFTIGTDPEVLLTDGERHVSAIGKLPGTKDEPVGMGNGMIHVDNVAGEFNTAPARCFRSFDSHIEEMMGIMAGLSSEHSLSISEDSVGVFSESEIMHPEAVRAGCDPDRNAYSCELNVPPELYGVPMRCAGGHIHIGADLSKPEILQLMKSLDLAITVPMLKYENKERRQLYGGAGAFRPKPYGVEYRTPSNLWIFTKERREWVYEVVAKTLRQFKDMVIPENLESVINNHDLDTAEGYVNDFKLNPFPV